MMQQARCLVFILGTLVVPILHAQSNPFTPPWKEVSSWDATASAWNDVSTVSYLYNANGQITEELTDFLNGTDTRISKVYHSNGKLQERIEEFQSGSVWTNLYRTTYIYNSLDSLAEKLDFQWQNGQWDTTGGIRHNYQYNNGRLENDFSFSWAPGSWENSRWFGYQYSSLGEWDTVQVYNWSNSQWQPVARTVDIAWADFSTVKFQSFTIENQLNGSYTPSFRREYNYTGAKDLEIFNFTWNNGWDSSGVFVQQYDAFGNLTLEEDFDFTNGVREEQLSQLFTHEYNGSNLLIRTVEQQSYFGGPYVNFEETIYPGYVVQLDSRQLEPLQAVFFPNPSSGRFDLLSNAIRPGKVAIEVFDGVGKMVWAGYVNQNGSQSVHMDVLNLNPGFYLYRLRFEQQHATGKLLVQ